jgi:hypothetical protein
MSSAWALEPPKGNLNTIIAGQRKCRTLQSCYASQLNPLSSPALNVFHSQIVETRLWKPHFFFLSPTRRRTICRVAESTRLHAAARASTCWQHVWVVPSMDGDRLQPHYSSCYLTTSCRRRTKQLWLDGVGVRCRTLNISPHCFVGLQLRYISRNDQRMSQASFMVAQSMAL